MCWWVVGCTRGGLKHYRGGNIALVGFVFKLGEKDASEFDRYFGMQVLEV